MRWLAAILLFASCSVATAQPWPGAPTREDFDRARNCMWAYDAVLSAANWWTASMALTTESARRIQAPLGGYANIRNRVDWIADYEAKSDFIRLRGSGWNGCIEIMRGHIVRMRAIVEDEFFTGRPYLTPAQEKNTSTPMTFGCAWPDFYNDLAPGRAIMSLPGASRYRVGEGTCSPAER